MTSRVLISTAQQERVRETWTAPEFVGAEVSDLSSVATLLQSARNSGVSGVYLSVEELSRLVMGRSKPMSTQGESSDLRGDEDRSVATEDRSVTTGEGALVWIIDDEAPVRITARRWLTRLGYRVALFERGEELLEALHERLSQRVELPSLLICDADMPEMSGITILTRFRLEAPEVKRLLYTAREPSKWVIEAFNQGVLHRFINKQDGPQALKACLAELLAEERASEQSVSAIEELLRDELIELYVQPIFNSKTSALEACEALMRSRHPFFKGPLEILDATTRAGKELDLQRLLTRLCVSIREHLPDQVALFMNIDPVVFSKPEALDDVFSPIYPHAKNIVLELTERGQLCGEVWVESVKYLRALGFRIALDDLGAGYNSLGAVAAVSPEIIKLDISLVSQIHQAPAKREMVKLLSEYAKKYGINTVAEGIELLEEAEVCASLDLTWLQGYFLSRPMPFEAFKATYL